MRWRCAWLRRLHHFASRNWCHVFPHEETIKPKYEPTVFRSAGQWCRPERVELREEGARLHVQVRGKDVGLGVSGLWVGVAEPRMLRVGAPVEERSRALDYSILLYHSRA